MCLKCSISNNYKFILSERVIILDARFSIPRPYNDYIA